MSLTLPIGVWSPPNLLGLYSLFLAPGIHIVNQTFYPQRDTDGHYTLHSIVSEHEKAITSICWHPTNSDIICVSSMDHNLIIWNISKRRIMEKVCS